jgi:hypothetical protein
MMWSDEEFCQRVVGRCKELGRSQRQVLKEAGLAHDYLAKPPGLGRRVDRALKLVEPLNWTVEELLGCPPDKADVRLLKLAWKIALEAMGVEDVASLDEATTKRFIGLEATHYNLLVRRHAEGLDVNDPDFLKLLRDVSTEGERLHRQKSQPLVRPDSSTLDRRKSKKGQKSQ